MRTLLLVALALLFPLASEAAKKPKSPSRQIANAAKAPLRVVTFVCRDSEDGPDNVIGLAHMTISLRNATAGGFSANIYVRNEKGYSQKTISGDYQTVPKGFVFHTRWDAQQADFSMNVHPGDKTNFPGLPGGQACSTTAQMESI